MKKKRKILLWIFLTPLVIIGSSLATILIYHKTYKVKNVAKTITNTTGLIQASGRGMYDKDGNEIIFRGVNLGGWFANESWLEPYAVVDPLYEIRDGELRPIYYTRNFEGTVLADKLSQDELIRDIKKNPNLTDTSVETVLDKFYDNWICEDDIKTISELGLNQVRIPLTWHMILNDDYTVRSDLNESLKYVNRCIDWCKENNIYVCLDLHSTPKSCNGYEHGGSIEWIESTPGKKYAKLWSDIDAINATIRIWETLSDLYNTNEYKEIICMYDIMNEPRNTTGCTDEVCWNVFDQIYDALRAKNDQHVICLEGMWTFQNMPNPKTYNWENVCYSYHWYNFSPLNKTDNQMDLYYAYQDMFNIGKNYNVPVYIGEFSFFDCGDEDATYSRWNKGLSMFEDRHYSWCIWTYKKFVNGWWNDSWGIYNLKAASTQNDVGNSNPYNVRINVAKATQAEIDDAFTADKIGTEACEQSVMYNVIKRFTTEH